MRSDRDLKRSTNKRVLHPSTCRTHPNTHEAQPTKIRPSSEVWLTAPSGTSILRGVFATHKLHFANSPQNLLTLLTRLHPPQPGQHLVQLNTAKNLNIIHGTHRASSRPTRTHLKLHTPRDRCRCYKLGTDSADRAAHPVALRRLTFIHRVRGGGS